MIGRAIRWGLCSVLIASLAVACSDSPERPPESAISVLVTDGSTGPPVRGAEIHLAPAGLTKTTDAAGRAVFHVPPGDYFVDAALCCVGPGLIQYHVPVALESGHTETVTLHACLSCE